MKLFLKKINFILIILIITGFLVYFFEIGKISNFKKINNILEEEIVEKNVELDNLERQYQDELNKKENKVQEYETWQRHKEKLNEILR